MRELAAYTWWPTLLDLLVKGTVCPLDKSEVEQLRRIWIDVRTSVSVKACKKNALSAGSHSEDISRFLRRAAQQGPMALLTLQFAGLVEWSFYRESCLDVWGGPMNGQQGRCDIVKELVSRCAPKAIVETGTFRGDSTAFLAEVGGGAPVYTCEVSPRFFVFALNRLWSLPQTFVFLEDSRRFLDRRARDPFFPDDRVLFYLDAHWGGDVPLAKEIAIIVERWKESVVVIDDFQVPDDPGYGYDNYGPGNALTLEYLDLPPQVELFWPAMRSCEETGQRRGCVVLSMPGTIRGGADLRTLRPDCR